MRKYVIELEGIGASYFGMGMGVTIELEGETPEDALVRAGYDLRTAHWHLITVRDVEDME